MICNALGCCSLRCLLFNNYVMSTNFLHSCLSINDGMNDKLWGLHGESCTLMLILLGRPRFSTCEICHKLHPCSFGYAAIKVLIGQLSVLSSAAFQLSSFQSDGQHRLFHIHRDWLNKHLLFSSDHLNGWEMKTVLGTVFEWWVWLIVNEKSDSFVMLEDCHHVSSDRLSSVTLRESVCECMREWVSEWVCGSWVRQTCNWFPLFYSLQQTHKCYLHMQPHEDMLALYKCTIWTLLT